MLSFLPKNVVVQILGDKRLWKPKLYFNTLGLVCKINKKSWTIYYLKNVIFQTFVQSFVLYQNPNRKSHNEINNKCLA